MRQLILYIIFMVSMVFAGYGEVSAASNLSNCSKQTTEDRLQKVEHKENQHDAQLEDASMMAYRVCSNRPQRLLPTGNIHAGSHAASRLLFNRTPFLSHHFHAHGGKRSRQESAPFHFDVASKYYVICLRHLLC